MSRTGEVAANARAAVNARRKVAKRLNDQHMMFSAGFYARPMGGRYFAARVHNGALQVSDWDTWRDVPNGTIFSDHNGREILTFNN